MSLCLSKGVSKPVLTENKLGFPKFKATAILSTLGLKNKYYSAKLTTIHFTLEHSSTRDDSFVGWFPKLGNKCSKEKIH